LSPQSCCGRSQWSNTSPMRCTPMIFARYIVRMVWSAPRARRERGLGSTRRMSRENAGSIRLRAAHQLEPEGPVRKLLRECRPCKTWARRGRLVRGRGGGVG
jgi:hypothetical protein